MITIESTTWSSSERKGGALGGGVTASGLAAEVTESTTAGASKSESISLESMLFTSSTRPLAVSSSSAPSSVVTMTEPAATLTPTDSVLKRARVRVTYAGTSKLAMGVLTVATYRTINAGRVCMMNIGLDGGGDGLGGEGGGVCGGAGTQWFSLRTIVVVPGMLTRRPPPWRIT